ncbi:MAG: hypothetical protein JRM99_07755 [Nitrososphaerota archaeon]|nr:hypothetical protein [Nitrososphaerota archaeon]
MKVEKRRGLSPIIAELLLIAITVVIGSTFFFVGTQSIGGYANGFSLLFGKSANAAQEIYIVEYAQFSPTPTVTLTIRNVGYIEVQLASVNLFNASDVASGKPTSGTYTVTTAPAITVVASTASPYCSTSGSMIVIPVGSFCTVSVPFNWSTGATYNVVISTERGNSQVVQEVA